eukprot:jgi/Psemu1/312490/fgenesh1_kg.963_\
MDGTAVVVVGVVVVVVVVVVVGNRFKWNAPRAPLFHVSSGVQYNATLHYQRMHAFSAPAPTILPTLRSRTGTVLSVAVIIKTHYY